VGKSKNATKIAHHAFFTITDSSTVGKRTGRDGTEKMNKEKGQDKKGDNMVPL
jgi:hypothetical protein